MPVIGGVLAGVAIAAIAVVVARGRTPRGRLSLSGERDTVWMATAGIAATGVALALDRPIVGVAIATGAAFATAWVTQKRLGGSTFVVALGGGALAGFSLVSLWPIGVAAGVAVAVAVAVLTREKLELVVPGRLLRVRRKWRGGVLGSLIAIVVGLLASVPHTASGLLLCALAAAVLLAYAFAVELGGSARWMVVLAGAALLLGPTLIALDADHPFVDYALAALTLAVSFVFAVELISEVTGPFDLPSTDLRHPFGGSAIEWAWVGAVTPTTATVTARVRAELDVDNIGVEPDGSWAVEYRGARGDLARFTLTGLTPASPCVLRLPAVGGAATAEIRFTTFPVAPTEVCIAVGSCASTGSRAGVFDRIAESSPKPAVFLHLGDLHYENIRSSDPAAFHAAYDTVFASAPQARLFGSLPIAHVWDDHDFGPNNSDSGSPSLRAAQTAYREVEPHYDLPAPGTELGPGPVYQRFTIGPVLVVLTDTRSERSPAAIGTKRRSARRIMSERQQEWLVDQVRSARADPDCELVVWACSTPWIGRGKDQDIWEGFEAQRRALFDQLRPIGMPLVFAAGDAHMIGIDDGTNTAPDETDRGFPVLAAASLDRRSSVKGKGGYTVGPTKGFGQFGTIRVRTTPELTVTLAVHDRDGAVQALVVDPVTWTSGVR